MHESHAAAKRTEHLSIRWWVGITTRRHMALFVISKGATAAPASGGSLPARLAVAPVRRHAYADGKRVPREVSCGSGMYRSRNPIVRVLAVLLCVFGCACGGSGNGPAGTPTTPTPPAPPPAPSPTPPPPPPLRVTVNITSAGTNPKDVRLLKGGVVAFTNSDARIHYITSDPVFIHTDCPRSTTSASSRPASPGTPGRSPRREPADTTTTRTNRIRPFKARSWSRNRR